MKQEGKKQAEGSGDTECPERVIDDAMDKDKKDRQRCGLVKRPLDRFPKTPQEEDKKDNNENRSP